MSVTRGKFLKDLGKSLPGMLLGGGVAAAAHQVLGKIAAVSEDSSSARSVVPSIAEEKSPDTDFIKSGPLSGNKIALTFDDGPTPGVTDRILDELKRRGLNATFFMIGERVAAAPDLARRVIAEGHEVGNHTFTHPKLTTLPDHQVETEVGKTQDVIRELLDHKPKWFRPPFGALRRNQAALVTRHDMRIVFWNVDPRDWSQPGVDKISGKILADSAAGSIVLCHDVHAQTADALGAVLDGLLERGLAVSTLSDLLE